MNEEDDIFNGLGIEIELSDRDDFLKVKETLTSPSCKIKQTDLLKEPEQTTNSILFFLQ